jgi:superfamily II DNA or RNA helicase
MTATLYVGNARSQFEKLPREVFALLRHELSFRAAEPSRRQVMGDDGQIRIVEWDGYTRLMNPRGQIPSGLVPRALRLLRKWQVPLSVQDIRERPEEQMPLWQLKSGFELRDYQIEDSARAVQWGRGVVDSPPRSGKTAMIAELLRQTALKTVVTAPTAPIARQTHARFVDLLRDWTNGERCPRDFYLLVGGPPKSAAELKAARAATVFVATADTAVSMPEHWWRTIQALVVDERHHQASKTYRRLNDLAVNAYYRWGFTGTNFRSRDGEQVALEACLGRIVARHSVQEMVERRVLVPGRVEFWPMQPQRGYKSARWPASYTNGIVECDPRNQLVALAADLLQRQGRRVLVLVHRIPHGKRLQALIPGSVFVESASAEAVGHALEDLNCGKRTCVIGSPVVGEGLDCPAADALIYAKGMMARVTHTQDMFRVLTACSDRPEKRDAVIIDFADRHNPQLLGHSVERLRTYRRNGLRVDVLPQLPVDSRQRELY